MPNIKDQSTVNAIAREFCSNGRKKGIALESVGYSKTYALESGRGCNVVFSNVRVIAAIAKIDAKHEKKLDHTRDIAIKLLTDSLAHLEKEVLLGNVQAITARTAVIRELNAISNLHSNTTNVNNTGKEEAQSDQEIKAGTEAAKIFKIRMANTG